MHFSLMVIGENPEEQLIPFDENLDVETYIRENKAKIIEKEKEYINHHKVNYDKMLKDKEAFYEEYKDNSDYISFIENEFPKKLNRSDEEICYDYIEMYTDTSGNFIGGYNPKSKWDYYRLGGRYAGMIELKDYLKPLKEVEVCWEMTFCNDDENIKKITDGRHADTAYKKDIANLDDLKVFALLKDGIWVDRGWKYSEDDNSDAKWESFIKNILNKVKDDELISIFDCHF